MDLLPTRLVEKVWGRDMLPPPFIAPPGKRIGEIWFEPPAALDTILVKYLFTSEKLSVQVHPSDLQAPEGSSGKEECWLVLDAEPDACLAIGFDREIEPDEMHAAAQDGSIEQLLTWHEARAGDFFYLPAGTVHAIGPGLSLIEVQQNCDITYRLYDYGRPRELHLEDAVRVASGAPYADNLHRSVPSIESTILVNGPHFRLAQTVGAPGADLVGDFGGAVLVLPLEGDVRSGNDAIAAGSCALCDNMNGLDFSNAGRSLIAAAA